MSTTSSTHKDGIPAAIIATSPITRRARTPELGTTFQNTVAQRQRLLNLTWAHLEKIQSQTGKPLFTILKARFDRPELTTAQLHRSLSKTNKGIVPPIAGFRRCLFQARTLFAKHLLELIASIPNRPADKTLEKSLIELGLHHYCAASLADFQYHQRKNP